MIEEWRRNPRWEYRVFGRILPRVAEMLRGQRVTRLIDSREIYIVSRYSEQNVKIREGRLDLKVLHETDTAGLELWLPELKAEFPVSPEEVGVILTTLGVEVFDKPECNCELSSFLSRYVEPHEGLQAVEVSKRRFGYLINGCIVERAELTVSDALLETAAVEQEDPALVMATARTLGIAGQPNLNYIQALKGLLAKRA
ncbi:MAG: hypothetical protein GY835_07185 [bacterium]|nr:hypothetical protein [bacterium]